MRSHNASFVVGVVGTLVGMLVGASGCVILEGPDAGQTSTGGSGGDSATGTGTGGAAPSDEVCDGAKTTGECVGKSRIRSCFVSEDPSQAPQVVEVDCPQGQI